MTCRRPEYIHGTLFGFWYFGVPAKLATPMSDEMSAESTAEKVKETPFAFPRSTGEHVHDGVPFAVSEPRDQIVLVNVRHSPTKPISREIRPAVVEVFDDKPVQTRHARDILAQAPGVLTVSDEVSGDDHKTPAFRECDIKCLILASFRVAGAQGGIVAPDGFNRVPPDQSRAGITDEVALDLSK